MHSLACSCNQVTDIVSLRHRSLQPLAAGCCATDCHTVCVLMRKPIDVHALCAGGGSWQSVGKVQGNTGLWRGHVKGAAPFSVRLETTKNQVTAVSKRFGMQTVRLVCLTSCQLQLHLLATYRRDNTMPLMQLQVVEMPNVITKAKIGNYLSDVQLEGTPWPATTTRYCSVLHTASSHIHRSLNFFDTNLQTVVQMHTARWLSDANDPVAGYPATPEVPGQKSLPRQVSLCACFPEPAGVPFRQLCRAHNKSTALLLLSPCGIQSRTNVSAQDDLLAVLTGSSASELDKKLAATPAIQKLLLTDSEWQRRSLHCAKRRRSLFLQCAMHASWSRDGAHHACMRRKLRHIERCLAAVNSATTTTLQLNGTDIVMSADNAYVLQQITYEMLADVTTSAVTITKPLVSNDFSGFSQSLQFLVCR